MINLKNKTFYAAMLASGILAVSACNHSSNQQKTSMTDSTTQGQLPAASGFDKIIDGKAVKLYTLKNTKGIQAAVTNYGGRLVSLLIPDGKGKTVDVVAGPGSADDYEEAKGNYYGALIGRYGNRIGNAEFKLEGKTYKLNNNDGPNTLHGGKAGFDVKVWDAKQVDDHTLELTYLSKDGEESFPGNLNVKVTYVLNDDDAIEVHYEATTDKPTIINLTNHTYWNLNGNGSGSILKHSLELNADGFTPVSNTLIPTGEIRPTANSPFDFRKPAEIGSRVGEGDTQLKFGKGYDHNFVLNKHTLQTPIAKVQGDVTGIMMEVFTEEPGIQFYTGNFMKGDYKFKGGVKDAYRTAFALETQHFPDSPNKPNFPTTELKPGQTYKTTTIYKFSAK
ncbi:galactose mutarotase [Mucilaginibacter robiniae]|uniref:Aldose 1-epimerase n=1 Tax=Mucilaginibacter robiniae TaxID=2728022 RepID=A0A7L5E2B5_9SPHI|nr:aldose epimerase family protein [Mucilaginibacter robiniae]QJD97432.1 galactose mutarotase [Mucilaginibacter robiniae]